MVSIDLLDNLKARFHDNSQKARLEILDLLGISVLEDKKSKDNNFTNSYITPSARNKYSPTIFKKRFQFIARTRENQNMIPIIYRIT